ncbi:sensor histidine kinase [Reichenbachiella ulvae]|uniref:Histidine kinase dimerization/phosphoacceptor domain-containing protein n=1 Tax=Reichenbachiella ulvae TaxID=2980104 RepID=A0ABT3CNB2_9BACT|nr:histidine kinase dimerization/phosphoacceptor domain-containing protein [Reichenbachiella ulvae]MCV9385195.1 histidine kinase dimerization/phosphoacceptor domain-containing protein [Reichenbachiella ulvae]
MNETGNLNKNMIDTSSINWGHLDSYCNTLVNQIGFDWAWIAYRPSNDDPLDAVSQSLNKVHTGISADELLKLDNMGPCRSALENLELISCRSISNCRHFPIWSDQMSEVGFSSYACLPVKLDDHSVVAINLYNHHNENHDHLLFKAIQELFELFGSDISILSSEPSNSQNELKEVGDRIHDGLSQMLTVISMNLSLLSKTKEKLNDSEQLILEETLAMANDAIKESRDISYGLRNI